MAARSLFRLIRRAAHDARRQPAAGEREIFVVQRIPRRHRRPAPIPAPWWRPGAYASAPTVALWIAARMPASVLYAVFGTPGASYWINHAGDMVFVAGWLASAALLWFTRRRAALPPQAEPDPASSPPRRRPAG